MRRIIDANLADTADHSAHAATTAIGANHHMPAVDQSGLAQRRAGGRDVRDTDDQ